MPPFFAKLKGRIERASYPAQIRLTILLFLLFLVVLNLQIAYLFEQSKKSLSQELESRMMLTASFLQQYWKERGQRWETAEGGRQNWTEEDISTFRTWIYRSGLQQVLWIPRVGAPLIIETSGKDSPAEAMLTSEGWKEAMQRAWRGEVVSTPIYQDESRRFFKALFVPGQRSPEEAVVALIALVAPADSLGNLSRFSSIILYGFLIGIPAAAVISLFFIDFVLSPYRRLSAATPPFSGRSEALADVDDIVATYEGTIMALREKELELARLYQMEQKRAQDLDSYRRYLLNNMSSGVLSVDPEFRIQACNPVAEEILGVSESKIQGRDAREVFSGMSELRSLLEETVQGGKIHQRQELEIQPEGGDRSWIGLSSSLLKDEAGMPEGVIFLLVDLTEVRRLQEQMRLKGNLAALGEMSAGIAHEFRNSLSTLLGQCRLLQRRMPEDALKKKTLEEMMNEILALEGVIQEFLNFARPAELKIQPLSLPDFLRELADSYSEPLAEAGIRMAIHPCPGMVISADPLALKQIFVNLIQNAREAMPGGGQLAISTKVPQRRPAEQKGKPLPWEGGLAVISVSDNGRGMGEEEKKKAFLPFFSTKEKGTGLGLAMVQKAAVGMGGKVEVESQLGSGATFHLYLPLTPATEGKENG
jgi:PAS domain S-box-containing protein